MFNFDKTTCSIACPACEFPNRVSMREVRFGLSLLCRGCKITIALVPADGGARKVKRVLDDFQNSFPRKITIKL